MDVQIYNRNLELTDRLNEYVNTKVEKFTRYLADIENVRVELTATHARDASRRMVAQVTIRVPRTILRAEERSGDIFTAFDAVMDKMYRRIKRYKGRQLDRRMEGVAAKEELFPETEPEEEEKETPSAGEIVRVKRFEVSSITPEEAVEQMELLGHYFYVFLDGTDGQLSIIYRREDRNYGLIKPVY